MLRKHLFPAGLALGLALCGGIIGTTLMTGDQSGPHAKRDAEARKTAEAVALDHAFQADVRRRLNQGIDEIKRLAVNSVRDIADLRMKIATLEQQQTGARQQMGASDRADRDTGNGPSEPAADARSQQKGLVAPPQGKPEEAEAEMQARLNALDKRAQSEKLDSRWATAAEKKVKDQIFANNIPGLNLVGAKCRSSLCRIELVRAASMPPEQSMRHLSTISPWPAPATAYIADTGEVVVYLAREGYDLP